MPRASGSDKVIMSGMRRLTPYLESRATVIAYALKRGADVEIVGEKLLVGAPLRHMEIDGKAVPVPETPQREAPGIRVSFTGSVSLYLMKDKEQAENVLARARELADV